MEGRAIRECLLASLISALLAGCAVESRQTGGTEPAMSTSTGIIQQPVIVHREAFRVMGTVTRLKHGAERPEIFATIWSEFEALRPRVEPASADAKYYGVSFPADAVGNYDYLAGIALRPEAETPEGLEVRDVPAAAYAVFTCSVESIGQTYGFIFGAWRAQSGYTTDDGVPGFEEYPPASDTSAPVLLHIPIRENRAR